MAIDTALETRHQVFISSTYTDLVEERRAVIQALLELDCFPAGMEMFPAANEDQWTLIKEVIEISDYYIVVVGGRYGSMTPEGISYTEKEFDYAVELDIPVLGFVHADPLSIPSGMVELEKDAREKLDAFREKVRSRPTKDYSSPDELASVVSRGLIRAIKKHKRPGWVRGDHAMTESTRTEIAELRAALSEAERERERAQLKNLAGTDTIDETFAHGDEEVELEFKVEYGGYDRKNHTVEFDFSWDELVVTLGPAMLDEAPEPQLRKLLCDVIWRRLLEVADGGWEKVMNPRVTIFDDSWGTVLVQLRALGVVTLGSKKRTVSDKSVYWKLTPAGDEYLVRLTAIKQGDIERALRIGTPIKDEDAEEDEPEAEQHDHGEP